MHGLKNCNVRIKIYNKLKTYQIQNTALNLTENVSFCQDNLYSESNINYFNYLGNILSISEKYLEQTFNYDDLKEFYTKIKYIEDISDKFIVVEEFIKQYIHFTKETYQKTYKRSAKKLCEFIQQNDSSIKIIWGDAYNVLKSIDNESVHLMVTSPPYYNARDYSTWVNINEYLKDMRNIIEEAYRVLDNHRVFVFNVGDIFDNDNIYTKSVWGKRRLPLGAYFIKIFEEAGFTFVDDFMWDKGEVQSERNKNGSTPYPFYQYPMNCYEHILIFHKHRLDKTRYPCPVCGTLKVNGNTQSEIGIQSWECKNEKCFVRSKSNRGKRFSLKSIITQAGQIENNKIDHNIIKKWRRDVMKFTPVIKINSKGENTLGHTAPFPEDIPEMAINFFSYPNEIVLDPFAGSFTSAIVANKLGRKGVGIELNKNKFRKAILTNIHKKIGFFADIKEFDF
ncbi:MAG: site-specific DNA-methyltransferase [Bacteroidia bacterium]|nr:site-specific DNA-methyltransferase [Bacteroidia bacterium]